MEQLHDKTVSSLIYHFYKKLWNAAFVDSIFIFISNKTHLENSYV